VSARGAAAARAGKRARRYRSVAVPCPSHARTVADSWRFPGPASGRVNGPWQNAPVPSGTPCPAPGRPPRRGRGRFPRTGRPPPAVPGLTWDYPTSVARHPAAAGARPPATM